MDLYSYADFLKTKDWTSPSVFGPCLPTITGSEDGNKRRPRRKRASHPSTTPVRTSTTKLRPTTAARSDLPLRGRQDPPQCFPDTVRAGPFHRRKQDLPHRVLDSNPVTPPPRTLPLKPYRIPFKVRTSSGSSQKVSSLASVPEETVAECPLSRTLSKETRTERISPAQLAKEPEQAPQRACKDPSPVVDANRTVTPQEPPVYHSDCPVPRRWICREGQTADDAMREGQALLTGLLERRPTPSDLRADRAQDINLFLARATAYQASASYLRRRLTQSVHHTSQGQFDSAMGEIVALEAESDLYRQLSSDLFNFVGPLDR